MQISSFETTSGLERKMTIDIDAKEIDTKINNKLKQLSHTAKLDGFRPGKVPMTVIKKRFHNSVRAEIINESIQNTLQQAMEEKSIRPANQPNVTINSDKDGENLEYTATFEIYPEVEDLKIDSIEVEKPTAEVPDTAVDEVLESWQKMRAEWQEVQRSANQDDRLNINYICFLNGEEVKEGSGENATVVLGRKTLIPGFEEGLIGLAANEEKTLNLTLPANHPVEKLANQDVELKVTVNKVEEPILPELDDKFCESCGVKEGGLDKLKEKIKDNLNLKLKAAAKEALKQAIFESLLANHDVELPQSMVENEKSFILASQNQTEEQLSDEEKTNLFEQASRSVKLGLLVGSFVNAHDIKPDQQKAIQLVKEIALGYEDPKKAAENILKNNLMMQKIMATILEEQAIDKLETLIKINEVAKDYQEVMDNLPNS